MSLAWRISTLIILPALSIGCGLRSSALAGSDQVRLTDSEKHRLYAAALASSDSPLDSDVFKQVCRRIEVFDNAGKPNEKYLGFVGDHIHWGMAADGTNFRSEIDTREKALAYVNQHLTRGS